MFNSFRLGFHMVRHDNLLNSLKNLDETEPKLEEKVAFHAVDWVPGW